MKLHDQVAYWKAHAQHQAQTIEDLAHYARLDKFSGVNEGINRDDVLHRLQESDNAMVRTMSEDFGEYIQPDLQLGLAL